MGIAALAACAFLFLKKHHISSDIFQTTEPQNKRAFIAFLKTPEAQQLKHVVDKQTKQGFLDITGIKNKFRHSNSDYMDPETILKKLEKASCVSSLTEKPFIIGKNKHITSGRKFNFVLQVKKGKKYNMVFEVHDYIKGEKKNWVMRIYDNDKIKDSRSYLTRIGTFVQNAYNDGFTHIPCGSLGERFVLGNKVCA